MPGLALTVGSMHNAVRSLLVKAVRIYKGDEESLQRSTRSTLAELYRTHWKQGTNQSLVQASSNVMDTSLPSGSCAGSTGMDVLAAAAWHHNRLQDVLDPRVTGLDTDPTTDIEEAQNGGPQDPAVRTSATQETNRMNHQTYEAEPNAIASNPNNIDDQASRRPWQPFDSIWPQEPAAHDTSYNGAINPLLNGFSQVEMPNGEGTMEVCTFWDDATYYDRLM
jgi:hypothetical protein